MVQIHMETNQWKRTVLRTVIVLALLELCSAGPRPFRPFRPSRRRPRHPGTQQVQYPSVNDRGSQRVVYPLPNQQGGQWVQYPSPNDDGAQRVQYPSLNDQDSQRVQYPSLGDKDASSAVQVKLRKLLFGICITPQRFFFFFCLEISVGQIWMSTSCECLHRGTLKSVIPRLSFS